MNDIQATSSSTSSVYSTVKRPENTNHQTSRSQATITPAPMVSLSSEAQYLFDMDKYLMKLAPEDLDKALAYLSRSEDPLQAKAATHFKEGQELLNSIRGGREHLIFAKSPSDKEEKLLDTNFVLDESTEIALIPPGVDVFRLDGKTNFSPVIFGGHNTSLNNELDKLEANSKGVLGNVDFANLFGSVRNALVFSENIMLSFDDVLHFNYGIEKAREAISFIDAPPDLTAKLANILDRSIAYQNSKQSQALSASQAYVSNSRVGSIASENIRLGLAAQRMNAQIQGALEVSGTSILDSQSRLNRVLVGSPELQRFDPKKIDEAISFYKQDYAKFERALNGELSTPTPQKEQDLYEGPVRDIDGNYAATVIQNIQSNALTK